MVLDSSNDCLGMTNALLLLRKVAVNVFFYLFCYGDIVVNGTKLTFYTLKKLKFNYLFDFC